MSPAGPLGHRGVVPSRQGTSPGPVAADVLDLFGAVTATEVSDCVGRLYTMDPGIKPLYQPMRRLAGVAVTVKAPPGDNWAVYGGLGQVFPGAVLVVDWRGHVDSCGGGQKALLPAIGRGLAGLVVDGAWRDVDEIAAMDFPICGRGRSAYSPVKRELGEVDVPVSCGGVVVEPGDVVVGDGDGVAVVPRRHLDDVVAVLGQQRDTVEAKDEAMVDRIVTAYRDAAEGNG